MTNFQEAILSFEALHAAAPEFFMPIQSSEDLQRATAFLYHFDFEVKSGEPHPLDPLADALMRRITAYEAEHFPIPDTDGASALAFLIDQHGLTQQQLADATGIKQETISALLSGKRKMTANHARKLADYFRVSVAAFL